MNDLDWVLDHSRVYSLDWNHATADVELRNDRRTVRILIDSDGTIWIDNVALGSQTGKKVLGGYARISNWKEDPDNYRRFGKPRGHSPSDWFLAAVKTWSGKRTDYSVRGWYNSASIGDSDQRQRFQVRQKLFGTAPVKQLIDNLAKLLVVTGMEGEAAHAAAFAACWHVRRQLEAS